MALLMSSTHPLERGPFTWGMLPGGSSQRAVPPPIVQLPQAQKQFSKLVLLGEIQNSGGAA